MCKCMPLPQIEHEGYAEKNLLDEQILNCFNAVHTITINNSYQHVSMHT